MDNRFVPPPSETAVATARILRSEGTSTERVLWERLRARRFLGIKFRRQQPIGTYIADFYSNEMRLVVEVDGSEHNDAEQKRRDAARDEFFREHGITVIRIPTGLVAHDMARALQTLAARIEALNVGKDALVNDGCAAIGPHP